MFFFDARSTKSKVIWRRLRGLWVSFFQTGWSAGSFWNGCVSDSISPSVSIRWESRKQSPLSAFTSSTWHIAEEAQMLSTYLGFALGTISSGWTNLALLWEKILGDLWINFAEVWKISHFFPIKILALRCYSRLVTTALVVPVAKTYCVVGLFLKSCLCSVFIKTWQDRDCISCEVLGCQRPQIVHKRLVCPCSSTPQSWDQHPETYMTAVVSQASWETMRGDGYPSLWPTWAWSFQL